MGATHVGRLAVLDPSCLTSFRVLGFFWAFTPSALNLKQYFSVCLFGGSLGEKKELRSMP